MKTAELKKGDEINFIIERLMGAIRTLSNTDDEVMRMDEIKSIISLTEALKEEVKDDREFTLNLIKACTFKK